MKKTLFTALLLLTTSCCSAGTTSTNGYFYLPDVSDTGSSVHTTWVATQEATDTIIKSNVDHKSATGASHSYIDQDVTRGSSPTFEDLVVGDALSSMFIGVDVMGAGNNSGVTNSVFLGKEAGYSLTTADHNVLIGSEAGYSTTTGYRSIFIGSSSGYSTTEGFYNIGIGYRAGYYNVTGDYNVNIGANAGVGISGKSNLYNVIIGYKAGEEIETGSRNIYIGATAGQNGDDGNNNIFIGYKAGEDIRTGSGNVAIGYYAGEGWLDFENDKLVIDNTDTTTPLIYGDFNTRDLDVNGTLTIGLGTLTLVGSTNNCIITIDTDDTCDAGTEIGEDNTIAICAVCASN